MSLLYLQQVGEGEGGRSDVTEYGIWLGSTGSQMDLFKF